MNVQINPNFEFTCSLRISERKHVNRQRRIAVGRVSRAKRAVTRQRIYRQPLPEQLAVADRVLARHTVSQTFR